LGLSHYPSLGGFGEAGVTDKMYVDGNRFKVGGQFNPTPLGKALFDAVRAELDLIKRGETPEDPIRISAAWWDIQHAHGDFKFTRTNLTDICPMCADAPRAFLKGQLDHFASTRVPMNPRTSLGLEEKSMAKVTRHDDAASIVDPELADELEERAKEELVGKSATEAEATDALIIKADEEPGPDDDTAQPDEPDVERAKTKTVAGKKFPASDFLVTEDPDKPSTWHLQYAKNGKPDHRLMGAAWAALHGGYRGKKYEGPDKSKAISKLKGVYKKEDMPLPTEKALVEMFGPEAIAVEWKPFGGATSLAEADDFMKAQELEWEVQDNWSMLRAVMDNILNNDEEGFDTLGAVRQAVAEFGDRVAALKANISDAYLLQPAIIKGATIMSEQEPIPAEEPTAPAEETPQNVNPASPGHAFWTDVQALLHGGGTRDQMISEAQGALESLAATVKNEIDAVRPPNTADELKAMLDSAIQAQIGPLAEKVELLLVKQQTPTAPAIVPQQKSITAPMPQYPAPVAKSPLTQMIRRSVGLYD